MYFQIMKIQSICQFTAFCPSNDILTIFPIQMHGRPKIGHKIGQGQPRVTSDINFVDLHSLMLHAKFQNHRPPGSEKRRFFKIFVIYSNGGHLGHVTMTIHANFHSLFLRMLHIKIVFDWPSGFREDVRIFWSYTCI